MVALTGTAILLAGGLLQIVYAGEVVVVYKADGEDEEAVGKDEKVDEGAARVDGEAGEKADGEKEACEKEFIHEKAMKAREKDLGRENMDPSRLERQTVGVPGPLPALPRPGPQIVALRRR